MVILIILLGKKLLKNLQKTFLIEIVEKLIENNGKLFFTNLDPTIEKTFDIMGLFQFAEKADSIDSVIK